MRGIWRRTEVISICFLLVSVFCYYLGVKSYVSMENIESAAIYLTGFYPDYIEAMEILEDCQTEENPVDICFYWDGGVQLAKNENFGRSSKVLVAGLTGDASLYNWRGNALNQENRSGCIIDQETALELFGSTNCIGSIVTLGEMQYEICRVVPWKYRIMLIHPTEEGTVYTRVFVRPKNGESLQNAASRFLMSCGLNGCFVDDKLFLAVALAALLFFPAGLIVAFFKVAEQRKRAAKDNKKIYWIWQCVIVFGVGILLVLIYRNFSISSEWLPDKWSNFEFWVEKIEEERENLDFYLMLPKTVPQTERIQQIVKSVLGGISSFILYLCAGKKFKSV